MFGQAHATSHTLIHMHGVSLVECRADVHGCQTVTYPEYMEESMAYLTEGCLLMHHKHEDPVLAQRFHELSR